ncbi:MAG: ABC transporter ATP-binding protein [Lentisphaerae bacterium]|nr:ABC transporter ATP-binding protein [Lentisphaerota bacterium]
MSAPAIRVENMGKRFRLRRAGSQTFKSAALDLLKHRGAGRNSFWALQDINFQVARGETLGIVGANGAGKSTLLSLLAGTKVPTTGDIQTRGNISSLLELGAGFHPDLTGRENVYLAGAIMGLSRRQMRERFEAIVEFAGLADFIDQPVKHYSSGMYVRLGFAVAVEVDPDILLIDEVLAVGDENFQKKCLRKMEDFRRAGKTLLIISHDLGTIQSISDRILFLDKGRVEGLGDPREVIGRYRTLSRSRQTGGHEREWGTGEARIEDVVFENEAGQTTDLFESGQRVRCRIRYRAEKRIEDPVFGFAFADANARLIFGSNTQIEGFRVPYIEGEGEIALNLGPLPVSAGHYLFSFSLHSADHRSNYHRLDHCFSITVTSESQFEGVCRIPCSWSEKDVTDA